MSDDMELLSAWRRGDKEAGTRLFRRHFRAVFLFFRSKVGVGVEDLAQRTFLACLEAGDRLDQITSFRAYLYGIARKQLLRHIEELERGKGPRGLSYHRGEASMRSLGASLNRRQEQWLLLRALQSLPVDQQIAIELFFWEEMSQAEIGAVLDIAEGTVKSRLFRAKEALRKAIVELEAAPDVRNSTLNNLDSWATRLRDELAERE